MNNLWFNIRFGTRHWQWGPNGMSFKNNVAQTIWRRESPETWRWFAIYTVFGKRI